MCLLLLLRDSKATMSLQVLGEDMSVLILRYGLAVSEIFNLVRSHNRNSDRHKHIELCAKSIKHFGNFGCHFPALYPQESSQHIRACAAHDGTKLSHIIGTEPILEMARAYGLRPRLWLLI